MSSPLRASQSSAQSSPAYRAPNRSQAADLSFEYEHRRDDFSHDTGFFVSGDGRRATTREFNVQKRRKVRPSDLPDAYGEWMPLPEGPEDNLEGDEDEGAETGDKRKRNASSEETMTPWRALVQRFLDEMARREGQGTDGKCPCCEKPFARNARRFRCAPCGQFVQCLDCVISRHQLTPLHRLEEWKGDFWTKSSKTSLSALDGYVYQLGHGGHTCPRPATAVRTMVVMDVTAIHTVKYRYCRCDNSDRASNLEQLMRNSWYPATTVDPSTCATFEALDLFRLLNVVGNINVHDFVGTLERQTDALQLEATPDRYKEFGRMARQYGFLKRLLRAGRAHDQAGVHNTKNGECAVLCWACPQDGMNLPEGWRDVSPEFQFLYMLFLAMDANFRLKNRLRANEHYDPPLGSGWGHLVEEDPYKEHVKNYVGEKDISTCIAFAALLQKDTRITTGLRTSGVGGVVCARHELVRPQGMGDLQKGERYANMDYILLASVLGITMLMLAISYDIACQWRINFPKRMEQMPEEMKLDLEKTIVQFGLPVWHAGGHEISCQNENSLSYMEGAGRTDGEGIERTWSVFNPIAWATKEMALGARADALEEKISHHNFEKNINQGRTLPRKLIVAIDERDRQVAAFVEVDKTLKKETRKVWQKKIDDWLADRSKPNPYMLEGGESGPSEANIRLELTKEEAQEAATGGGKLHGSSVMAFLSAGMQLEQTQSRIRREVKGRSLLAADQNQRIAEMRRSFFTKLSKFRKLQGVYMPGAIVQLEEEEEKRDEELPPPNAEDVKLYLPSGMRGGARSGCKEGVADKEGRLREGQCRDAMRKLRSHLHTKKHLLGFRDENAAGQRTSTRSQTLIGRVGERVDTAADKYRHARKALIALKGAEACSGYRELKKADLELDDERGPDVKARKKLGAIGSKWRRQGILLASRKKPLSWIWTEGGGPGEDEAQLHDCVRVEWSKAKARKDRWEEEVSLIREEMKRVLRFLRWRANWWEMRRGTRTQQVTSELRAGLQAYAARQAAGARETARRFKREWDRSAATAVRQAVEEEAWLVEGMVSFSLATGDGDAVDGSEGGNEGSADEGGYEGSADEGEGSGTVVG